MSSVVISGDTSGAITLAAPAIAGTNTITLPAGTGTATVAGVNSNIVSGTAQATTSGTSITFTGIPSWAKRITVMFSGVIQNSAATNMQIQLVSSTTETTGYISAMSYVGGSAAASSSITTGFGIQSNNASASMNGSVIISLLNSTTNTWVANGNLTWNTATTSIVSGSKSLASALTGLVLTTISGAGTFTAGSINIMYE